MSASAQAVLSSETDQPWILVTHQNPDTDAWACLWAANRFMVPREAERFISFVRAGEKLPDEETVGHNVVYMDTSGGDFDQHGKKLVRGSSFQLLCEKIGIAEDPGIRPILELTRVTDNVERLSPTSIHFYFKGLPSLLRDGQNEVDWDQACTRVFEVLNIVYGQEVDRAAAAVEFAEKHRVIRLKNGICVASLFFKPYLRESAFAAGADVVLFTAHHGKAFTVGIQINRDSNVTLKGVARVLRFAEAKERGITITRNEAETLGTARSIPGWYLHDSEKLIVCGSKSHMLQKGEHTKLDPKNIFDLMLGILERSAF